MALIRIWYVFVVVGLGAAVTSCGADEVRININNSGSTGGATGSSGIIIQGLTHAPKAESASPPKDDLNPRWPGLVVALHIDANGVASLFMQHRDGWLCWNENDVGHWVPSTYGCEEPPIEAWDAFAHILMTDHEDVAGTRLALDADCDGVAELQLALSSVPHPEWRFP